MTALIQNFSVPADNDVEVMLQVDPDLDLDTLEGSQIYWRVYSQQFGIPDFSGSPGALIEKSTLDGSILLLPSPPPMQCKILISGSDTTNLLRNYCHVTTLIDVASHKSTINCGIMTVTAADNSVP